MKNQIICYAQDYNLDRLTNIINSFKQNASNNETELVILHKNLLVTESNNVSNVSYFDTAIIDRERNVDTTLSPYTLKVIYFYMYCKYTSTADSVFLCDSTDVFFNKSPFELIKDKVSLFVENQTIANCPVNTQWLQICYNGDICNIIKSKPILNGGLILGKRTQCVYLLKEMCADIAGVIGRIGNYRNLDQAVLNKIVYFDQLNYYISSDQSMINCAHINNYKPRVEFKNKQIEINSKLPHVVHQYPCFKSLEVKW